MVSRTRVRDEEGLEGRYKPLSSPLLWEMIITGDGLPVLNTWWHHRLPDRLMLEGTEGTGIEAFFIFFFVVVVCFESLHIRSVSLMFLCRVSSCPRIVRFSGHSAPSRPA